jgi:oligoribonuclease
MKKLCPNCETPLSFNIRDPARGDCLACGWVGHLSTALANPRPPVIPPKMPYLSIDIETTGLDPDWCQILEIGAVWDNWTLPMEDLPTYRRLVVHDEYRGQPFALAMNAALLRELAGEPKPWFLHEDEVAIDFATWLKTACGWDGETALTPAGKNFSSFDRNFLKRLPRFEKVVRLHHRSPDPANFFWRPLEDDKLPDTKTCYERAGMDGKVAHTAVEDALGVVRLIRMGAKRLMN